VQVLLDQLAKVYMIGPRNNSGRDEQACLLRSPDRRGWQEGRLLAIWAARKVACEPFEQPGKSLASHLGVFRQFLKTCTLKKAGKPRFSCLFSFFWALSGLFLIFVPFYSKKQGSGRIKKGTNF